LFLILPFKRTNCWLAENIPGLEKMRPWEENKIPGKTVRFFGSISEPYVDLSSQL
jgi:hypothetical protein